MSQEKSKTTCLAEVVDKQGGECLMVVGKWEEEKTLKTTRKDKVDGVLRVGLGN